MRSIVTILSLFWLATSSVSAFAQSWKWAKGSSVVDGYCESWSVATDPSGNVYSAGYTESLSSGSPYALESDYGVFAVIDSYNINEQGVLVSTDSNGNYRWALGTQNGIASLLYVATDRIGNVYVTGYDSSGSFSLGTQSYSATGPFCAKVDAAGNVLWIKNLAPGTQSYGILTGSGSNMYAFGSFTGTTMSIGSTTLTNNDATGTSSDAFYAKYDSSGNPLWAKSFGGTLSEYIYTAALTNDSELCLAGPYYSPSVTLGSTVLTAPSGGYLYVAKFNSSGSPVWAKTIVANDSLDGFNGMAIDPDYNIYLTGIYWHHLTIGIFSLPVPLFANMFLAKYDSSGNVIWAQAQRHISDCFGVAADKCGNLWVCGSAQTLANPPLISDTLYLAEYDTSGVLEDIFTVNSGGDDNSGIVVDNNGNFYVGGDYLSYLPFAVGSDTLTFSDSTEEAMFILKYNYEPGGVCLHDTETTSSVAQLSIPLPLAGVSVYPNPARTEVTLSAAYNISKATIYDFTGRAIFTHEYNAQQVRMDISGLLSGIYFIRINDGDTVKFLKE